MNLEKFIEVNNFMPVPPQKPPTAQHLSSSFAPGLPPSRLPEQRLASKFVNLSVDAHANYSEDPPSSYPRGGVELALQMYAPQPSMRLKRDSRRNSISSESEEAKKKTSLPNSGLATPSIASVTPTALFRNTPLATLPSTVKKVVSTQPTSRSASMNLSRGTDRGLPQRLFSDQNFSGIGVPPPRHQRVLSLQARIPPSRIQNPKLLKKTILDSLSRGSLAGKNTARFNPPPHELRQILAAAKPARFFEERPRYRKFTEVGPSDAMPQQLRIRRNVIDGAKLLNAPISADTGPQRLIHLLPTDHHHHHQEAPAFFKKEPPFNEHDLSYLGDMKHKRFGTAMSEDRQLKTGTSPLRPKIIKNKLPSPFKTALREARDIGTAQTSAAAFGGQSANIFTPPGNPVVRGQFSVNQSIAMTEVRGGTGDGRGGGKRESIIEVQSCTLTDEQNEEDFDRAVKRLDFGQNRTADAQQTRELENSSVLVPFPDPIQESYLLERRKVVAEGSGGGGGGGVGAAGGGEMKMTLNPTHAMGALDTSGASAQHTPQLKRETIVVRGSEGKPRIRQGERHKVSYTPSTAATSESLKLERPFSGRFSLGPKVRFKHNNKPQ